jgi:hypothetical protein
MKPIPFLFSILTLFLLNICGYAQPRKPQVSTAPSWASVGKYNYEESAALYREGEDGYFDIAFEQQVSLEQQSVYCRKAIKILTEAGIQNSSEISVSFDPSYQQLLFHNIRIIRDGKSIDHLNLSKFKTIQQEEDLRRHIYNGSLSAVLFLEDIRKGDVIEYSYTIKGFNPIFKGKYASIYDLDFQVPVGSLYYKLIVPKGREISIKSRNTDIKPAIREGDRESVYEWKLDMVKPVRLQDNVPSWFDPYSTVFVSEYKSWKEVIDWAINLFPLINDMSPALQKKIAEIRLQNNTPEKQILAALRFVQDDIRYLGIEMGVGSHKPGNPNKIIAQRFGDCKDKAYLLCTMLNALGIQASPVLINTVHKKTITEWLPASNAFDHVTVQVQLNDKKYWFDPTISFQRGSINSISYPDYQYGLVVHPATESLEKINVKEPGLVKVNELFNIPDMSGKATLKVVTNYTGSYADDVRSSFNNSSDYEMQKTFRDYYAVYYKQISADSITHEDNEATGTFITREYYTIEGLWELENSVKKASFSPFVIDGIIKRPKDLIRKMPFSLMWPAKYNEEIEINLPEDWSAEQTSEIINTGDVSMTARFSHDGRKTIYLAYTYENTKDHINATEIKEYSDALEKKSNKFSYVLSYAVDGAPLTSVTEKKNDTAKSNGGLYKSLLALLVIGGIIWRIVKK